jgi:Domain of unknown function (DUF1841)
MSLLDGNSRDQLRLTFAQAWAKRLARAPLAPLEAQIADVIEAHPEYQRLVADADTAVGFDSGHAAENPFLHFGLHLAVRDQLAVDLPPGIRDLERQLQARYGDAHRAEHTLMEALSEELWTAQHEGRAPDERRYLALARKRLTSVSAL